MKRNLKKTHSVIWQSKTRIEFYQNGIWDGRRYTQPTLTVALHPDQLEHIPYPRLLEAFKRFEKTGEMPNYKA